jgi:hypothetical protein
MKKISQSECNTILNESISSIFIKTPKFLQQALGLRECAVLSNLLEKWNYFFKNGMLQKDNSFYLLQKYQALEIGISEYEISQAKKNLKSLNLITIIKKGIPAKEYYLLDFDKIEQVSSEARQKYEETLENLNKNNSLSKFEGQDSNGKKIKKTVNRKKSLQTLQGLRGQDPTPDERSIYNKNKVNNKTKKNFSLKNIKLEKMKGSKLLRTKVVPGGTKVPEAPKGTKKLNGKNNKKSPCKKVKGSKLLRTKVVPGGTKVPEAPKGTKKLNGKNNKKSPCKKVKVQVNIKKHESLEPPKSLPKIKIEPNPLQKFNFKPEVFEILNHWRILGGKIPKDPNRRKVADNIANQIQALLIKGNNPYTSILKDNELEQFRTKKWTVQEIKDSITYFKKELCRPIENIVSFLQFIVHHNYNSNQSQRDYSPLVSSFSALPQNLSYLANKLKTKFEYFYDDIHFYDKSFSKIGSFLEQKLIDYKPYVPHANRGFCVEDLPSLFLYYMDQQVIKEGKQDCLKYMSKDENLNNFISHLSKLNVIKHRTDEELKNYKKETKERYEIQYGEYGKMINSGVSKNWNEDQWEYFEFLKEQVDAD